jgi:hypothetical protein
VSTKTICASRELRIPVIRLRVVCGRGETIASFSPTSRFRSVDLPAFGRPTRETKPERKAVVAARAEARAGLDFVTVPRRSLTEQSTPEPPRHRPRGAQDLTLTPVHQLRLDVIAVIVAHEMEDTVRDEEIHLDGDRHAEALGVAPRRLGRHHDLPEKLAPRLLDLEGKGQNVGTPMHAEVLPVQPGDLGVVHEEDLDLARWPSHRVERRLGGTGESGTGNRDTALSIDHDSAHHPAAVVACPPDGETSSVRGAAALLSRAS